MARLGDYSWRHTSEYNGQEIDNKRALHETGIRSDATAAKGLISISLLGSGLSATC